MSFGGRRGRGGRPLAAGLRFEAGAVRPGRQMGTVHANPADCRRVPRGRHRLTRGSGLLSPAIIDVIVNVDPLPLETSREVQALGQCVSRDRAIRPSRIGHVPWPVARVHRARIGPVEHSITTCGITGARADRWFRPVADRLCELAASIPKEQRSNQPVIGGQRR